MLKFAECSGGTYSVVAAEIRSINGVDLVWGFGITSRFLSGNINGSCDGGSHEKAKSGEGGEDLHDVELLNRLLFEVVDVSVVEWLDVKVESVLVSAARLSCRREMATLKYNRSYIQL